MAIQHIFYFYFSSHIQHHTKQAIKHIIKHVHTTRIIQHACNMLMKHNKYNKEIQKKTKKTPENTKQTTREVQINQKLI